MATKRELLEQIADLEDVQAAVIDILSDTDGDPEDRIARALEELEVGEWESEDDAFD